MTYATLKTDVANFLHRTDLTAKIPSFIETAESSLFRELSVKDMEVSVTGTTTGGYASLPADFGQVKRVSVTANGYSWALDYINPAEVSTTTTAYPKYYSLENNQLKITQASNGTAYTLYYVPNIEALSDTNTTNWLLDNAKDLYLYASCLAAAVDLRDSGQVATLTTIVNTLIESVRNHSKRRGLPDGSMRIRPRG